jgi:hypothetical protein
MLPFHHSLAWIPCGGSVLFRVLPQLWLRLWHLLVSSFGGFLLLIYAHADHHHHHHQLLIAAVLYQVRAQISHCNQFVGCRKLVYYHAQMHGAICNQDLAHSIFYADNGRDLQIILNFENRASAVRFVGELFEMRSRHLGPAEDFRVERNVVEVPAVQPYSNVFTADYQQNDSSPLAATVSVTVYNGEPEKRLQCIEDIEKIDPHLVNRCHIASQAMDPALKALPGNIFYASRDFHAYFDGDSKELPLGQDPWAWGTPPKFWIEFLGTVEADPVSVGRKRFYRVNIAIHFHARAERVVLDSVIARLKEGAQVVTEQGCTVAHTYFYSPHTLLIHNYFAQRNVWVQRRWRVGDDMRTPLPPDEFVLGDDAADESDDI